VEAQQPPQRLEKQLRFAIRPGEALVPEEIVQYRRLDSQRRGHQIVHSGTSEHAEQRELYPEPDHSDEGEPSQAEVGLALSLAGGLVPYGNALRTPVHASLSS
jgi:hypothetical protein